MALFWPAARLAFVFSSEPAREHRWPQDVLVLNVRDDQLESEEFIGRAQRLILSRLHYLRQCAPLPDQVRGSQAVAVIRQVVRGNDCPTIDL